MCDQTFAVDHHGVKEAVVVRPRRGADRIGLFVSQQDARNLLGGIGRAHLIDLVEPGGAFVGQVSIVVEGAPGQEVALDELDQVLDRAFLVAGTGRTGGRDESRTRRHTCWKAGCQIGWLALSRPSVTVFILSVVTTQGTPPSCDETGDQAAQQGFLAHLGGKADEHPAAVLEAGGEEVAGLAGEVGAGEGEAGAFRPNRFGAIRRASPQSGRARRRACSLRARLIGRT